MITLCIAWIWCLLAPELGNNYGNHLEVQANKLLANHLLIIKPSNQKQKLETNKRNEH